MYLVLRSGATTASAPYIFYLAAALWLTSGLG